MATNPIQNVVVLMFENRSYDNVLGAFFNGINANLSNVDPSTGQPINVWGSASDATTIPATDPGEQFDDMAQQFLGLTDIAPDKKSVWPASGSLTPGPYGLMGGFVANYAMQKGNTANLADVMHSYVPALMPVTNYLAKNFMVCDSWFASVPSQTFVNRLFLSAAAPGFNPLTHASFVNDVDYFLSWGLGGQDLPNVFQQLDAANPAGGGANWKLYFHDYSIAAHLLSYVHAKMSDPSNVNLANYDNADYPPGSKNPIAHPTSTFLEDIANGTLPPFSLIEPRYSDNYGDIAPGLHPNSNHPGSSRYPLKLSWGSSNAPIDVTYGELLLAEVYVALRTSGYWENTLLIVTYDEPGGTYDHVAPLPAKPPGGRVKADVNGFNFNWFGGRVPAIIISPYAPAGGQLVAPEGSTFDHTSVIATLRDCFPGMGDAINARDAAAPSIIPALTASGNNPDVSGVPK